MADKLIEKALAIVQKMDLHTKLQFNKLLASSITSSFTPPSSPIPISIPIPPSRKEVQAHGFTWENEIKSNVYGVTPEELIEYTGKHDIPSAYNRLDVCDISIKTTGRPNAVDMADCLRVFDTVSSGTPYHLTVITYEQDTKQAKKIKSIIEVDLTGAKEILFGTLTREEIESLDKKVKEVPQKRRPTAEEYEQMYSLKKQLQPKSSAMYIGIKCDSSQSRLQCAFNSFQQFLEKNKERIIAQSNSNEFRGGKISETLQSTRRQMKE